MGIRKTHKEFVKEVYEIYHNDIKVLGKYAGAKIKIKVKCNKCNYIWWRVAEVLIQRKTTCPNCRTSYKENSKKVAKQRNIKAKGNFKCKFDSIHKGKYELVDPDQYLNNSTKVDVICRKHGIFQSTPQRLLMGFGCNHCRLETCADHLKKSPEYFYQEILELGEQEYDLLSSYKGAHQKVTLRHKKCGYVWSVFPSSFLSGRRCPNCAAISKGEENIRNVLSLNKVKYKTQFAFKGCKDKSNLRFDFNIHENDFLIEYDGEQHFKMVEYWGGEDNFKSIKNRDKIKNQYCTDNNIPLIRIPYWEFDNIEYILNSVLQHYNLIERNNTYDESVIHKWLVNENWDQDKYISLAPCNKNKLNKTII